MIPVDCRTCRSKGRCEHESARYRQALFAWAKGIMLQDCNHYTPRYYHGIEGVYPCLSPRPSLVSSEQRKPS